MTSYCLAIDIGASGGRHIVGRREGEEISTREIYRFKNGMKKQGGATVWDVEELFAEVLRGIRLAAEEYPTLSSIAIDTWGADYVLFRGDEEVKPTYAYRDARTDISIPAVHGIIPFEELYKRTGMQLNRFNSIYQLYHDKMTGRLEGATDFLMIPEYLYYRLSGVKVKEYTNATTTGLISALTGEFDREIISALGLPEALFKPTVQPGGVALRLKRELREELGIDPLLVLTATHDTASAVHSIEMKENSPYVSSGTWSLLGVKTEKPLTDARSMAADFSNEGGIGYTRYQKNITGMWIIQCLRSELCPETDYGEISRLCEESGYRELFDVNDPAFTAPESMKEAILGYLGERGKPLPGTASDYFSSAFHSLAACYAEAVAMMEENVGRSYSEIYIVGGGARNGLLNRLTAEYCGKRVIALPVEATALGNLKIQLEYLDKKEKEGQRI